MTGVCNSFWVLYDTVLGLVFKYKNRKMEGIGEFFNGVLKVLCVVFAIGLLCTTAYLYEENKKLRKSEYECSVELKIIQGLMNN